MNRKDTRPKTAMKLPSVAQTMLKSLTARVGILAVGLHLANWICQANTLVIPPASRREPFPSMVLGSFETCDRDGGTWAGARVGTVCLYLGERYSLVLDGESNIRSV